MALHGGRNHPVVPMEISFKLWFSPAGLLPTSTVPRLWMQDVDWVLPAADVVLGPGAVDAEVNELRTAGRAAIDTVPAAKPPLDGECRF